MKIFILFLISFVTPLKVFATNLENTPLLKQINFHEIFCWNKKNYYKIDVKNGLGTLTLVGDTYEEPHKRNIGVIEYSTEIKQFSFENTDYPLGKPVTQPIVSAKTYVIKILDESDDEAHRTLMFANLLSGDEVAIYILDDSYAENYGTKSNCDK